MSLFTIRHEVHIIDRSSQDSELVSILRAIVSQNDLIIQKLNNMPTTAEFEAAFKTVDDASTEIGAAIADVAQDQETLKAEIQALKISEAEKASILTRLQGQGTILTAAASSLKALASSVENPNPEPLPDVTEETQE